MLSRAGSWRNVLIRSYISAGVSHLRLAPLNRLLIEVVWAFSTMNGIGLRRCSCSEWEPSCKRSGNSLEKNAAALVWPAGVVVNCSKSYRHSGKKATQPQKASRTHARSGKGTTLLDSARRIQFPSLNNLKELYILRSNIKMFWTGR